MSCRWFVAWLVCGLVVVGCGVGETFGSAAVQSRPGDGWVKGALIDPSWYELSEVECETRIAEEWVDGVLTEGEQYWGRVTITNLLDRRSPNYEIKWRFTFEDGSVVDASSLVLRIDEGESAETAGLAGSEFRRPSAPVRCEVQVEDSVLNH